VREINFKGNKELPYLLSLLGIFFVSRFVYDRIGITFLGDTYNYYWQFISPSLLRTDLWRSVFYLHSQPPLLNVLTGVVLQLFPNHVQGIFHFLYFLAGGLLVVSMYLIGVDLGLPRWMSLFATAMFTISPSTILYEHWLMYGYLIASALTFSGAAIYRFAKTHRIFWGVLAFSMLAIVALLWTLFHLVWMLIIIIMTFYFFQERKKVVLAALVPFLFVFGWYAKNLVVFGEFTAGTWGGMNLANMTTLRLSEEERHQMVVNGELSSFADYPPFRSPAVYLRLLPNTPTTGIPLLDITEFEGVRNQHHLVYIDASRYFLRDALHVIRTNPGLYLRSVLQSLYIYFHSSSDFKLISGIRQPIQTFDVGWNRLFYGQWLNNESLGERVTEMSPSHVGWWILVSFIFGVLGSARYFWRTPNVLSKPDGLLILFMMFNILFVTIVSNAMDIGENNRFRYVVDPFIFLLALYVFNGNIWSRLRNTVHMPAE